MALELDRRHRAMLREMGVRVWLPQGAPPAASPVDPADSTEPLDTGTAPVAAHAAVAVPPASPAVPVARPPAFAPAAVPTAPSPATRTAPPPAAAHGVAVAWRLGDAVTLYAATEAPDPSGVATASQPGPRWLVLAETPAAALTASAGFDPFQGDAGRLLDNMLRAARLPQAGAVLLAPLTRQAASTAEPGTPALQDGLAALIARARPDIVLVMGRLASLALLQSQDAFGKLRGQVHDLHGMRAVVTCDATYLLRNQADKARAWDDLCLAMAVAAD